jgi:hypothetical protein
MPPSRPLTTHAKILGQSQQADLQVERHSHGKHQGLSECIEYRDQRKLPKGLESIRGVDRIERETVAANNVVRDRKVVKRIVRDDPLKQDCNRQAGDEHAHYERGSDQDDQYGLGSVVIHSDLHLSPIY